VLTGSLVGGVIAARLVGSDNISQKGSAPVLVAKQLIPAGTTYETMLRRDLVTTEYRLNAPNEDMFTFDLSYLRSRATTRPVFTGEPVRPSDFLAP
jgi:hypothetical protein